MKKRVKTVESGFFGPLTSLLWGGGADLGQKKEISFGTSREMSK